MGGVALCLFASFFNSALANCSKDLINRAKIDLDTRKYLLRAVASKETILEKYRNAEPKSRGRLLNKIQNFISDRSFPDLHDVNAGIQTSLPYASLVLGLEELFKEGPIEELSEDQFAKKTKGIVKRVFPEKSLNGDFVDKDAELRRIEQTADKVWQSARRSNDEKDSEMKIWRKYSKYLDRAQSLRSQVHGDMQRFIEKMDETNQIVTGVIKRQKKWETHLAEIQQHLAREKTEIEQDLNELSPLIEKCEQELSSQKEQQSKQAPAAKARASTDCDRNENLQENEKAAQGWVEWGRDRLKGFWGDK